MEKAEFVEAPDRSIKDSSFSANPIKMRRKSFETAREKYRRHLDSLYKVLDSNDKNIIENELASVKATLVEDEYAAKNKDELAGSSELTIHMLTNAIARLEEKIMILSKSTVPKHYVGHRAIKLKKKMMDNLVYNSDSGYFALNIPKEKEEKFFEETNESVQNPIDVKNFSPENVNTMAAEINKAMGQEEVITREEIDEVLENKFDTKYPDLEEQPVIEETMPIEDKNVIEVTPEEVAQTVTEDIKKEQEYTPMTDEEIAHARAHLWPNEENFFQPVEESSKNEILPMTVEEVSEGKSIKENINYTDLPFAALSDLQRIKEEYSQAEESYHLSEQEVNSLRETREELKKQKNENSNSLKTQLEELNAKIAKLREMTGNNEKSRMEISEENMGLRRDIEDQNSALEEISSLLHR